MSSIITAGHASPPEDCIRYTLHCRDTLYFYTQNTTIGSIISGLRSQRLTNISVLAVYIHTSVQEKIDTCNTIMHHLPIYSNKVSPDLVHLSRYWTLWQHCRWWCIWWWWWREWGWRLLVSSPRWWTIAPWSHHRRLVSTVTTIFVISNQLPPLATSLAAIFNIVNSDVHFILSGRGQGGILAFQIYVSIFWFILTIRYLHSCARLYSEHAATKITHNWPKTNFCLVHMTQTPKAV